MRHEQRQGKNFIVHDQKRLDKALAKKARKAELRYVHEHSFNWWSMPRISRLRGARGLAGFSGRPRSK